MELPIELKMELEKISSKYKKKQLQEIATSLTTKYMTQSGKGNRLVTKDIEAIVYAIVRMPATFGAISTVLSYTLEYLNDGFESMLDIGAGTGATMWSITSLIDNPLDIICVEREESMIELGKKLALLNDDLKSAKWIKRDFSTSGIIEKADLVVASYSLNELNEESRLNAIKHLWNATKKVLIIIEPGTPIGFSQIKFARDILIQDGGYVIAPCPHNNICPMSKDDWCHFTCRVSRSRLHRILKDGEVPYEDEKFTFIAISKTPIKGTDSRILRHPLKKPGMITLQLCTSDGLQTKNVTKKQGELFKKARKSNSGDSF